jgi:glycosyltransferase involved in cell wall biosynthesis
MNKYNCLLSIIIPTKDRYECLIPVIAALVKYIKSDDIEFILQDNSGNNIDIKKYLNNLNDTRVKYFYKKKPLSIVDNTICAIQNAKGKYLVFIGDDDLVSPYIYEFVSYLEEKDIDCLVYNPAYYWWNSIEFVKENYFFRKCALWLPSKQSLFFEKRNSCDELELLLASGGGVFQRLPKFYHGIVKREVLDKIKTKTGTYLPGSSPDIAFSTSLTFVIKEYFYVNYPLSVFGASKNSGGGWTASNKHYGKIEDQKHLPKNLIHSWNKYIPRIWSEKTIYAQTVTEILKIFKSNRQFNFISFYGTMLAYEPFLVNYLMPSVRLYCGLNIFKYCSFGYIFIAKKFGIFYRNFRYFSKSLNYKVIEVNDVDLVMEELSTIRFFFPKVKSNN